MIDVGAMFDEMDEMQYTPELSLAKKKKKGSASGGIFLAVGEASEVRRGGPNLLNEKGR